MNVLSSVLFGILSIFGAGKVTTHYMVVDHTGQPVVGAKVDLSWQTFAHEGRKIVTNRGTESCLSDEDGRVSMGILNRGDIYAGHVSVRGIEKEGYVLEDYQNPDIRSEKQDRIHPKEAPFKIVLRKRNEEKEMLLRLQGDCDDLSVKAIRGKPSPQPLAVSLLNPGRLSRPGDYIDFLVQPSFDEMKKSWVMSFWTTNENAGIIATTNRVYVAPESGYAKRVEVSREDFQSRTFTLYLKTFSPQVYAMVYWQKPLQNNKETEFQFKLCQYDVNPFGGRVFENIRVGELMWLWVDFTFPALHVLRDEHRYPPYPDVKARMVNISRQHALEDEMSKLRNKFIYDKRKEIDALKDAMKAKGATENEIEVAVSPLRHAIEDASVRIGACYDEITRLKAEFKSLNLPEPPPYSRPPAAAKSPLDVKEVTPTR